MHESSTAFQAAMAALLDLDVDGALRASAAATADRRREAWAAHRGLKQVTGGQCVLRLRQRKNCGEHYFSHRAGAEMTTCAPTARHDPWHFYDHASLWARDGFPAVFVFHPYGFTDADARDLLTFCDKNDFAWLTNSSWYFPGATQMIEIRRRDDVLA